jgi:endonuclease/exonuclease/phosphatase family metal-dependent hydrolase
VEAVPAARREAIREGARDRATHARLLRELTLDEALDVSPFPGPASPPRDRLRVVAWNLERCKHLEASAALLASLQPDLLLLSELDWGMARSGNRQTARELASRLGCAYAFGAEFLELDLGSPAERAACAGLTNQVGYHGNAVLARFPLQRPRLVRIERRGDWFDGSRGEGRVGGRCAVLAQVPLAGRALTVAAVHLDSHGTREQRADEMQALLEAIDAYDRGAPALIGGDLNSFSLALAELGEPGAVAAALRADPRRWAWPVPHEPLFERAARAGFEWESGNAPGVPTLRHPKPGGAPGESARGALKLDWLLCRGVAGSTARVIDAVGPDGRPLSDHEAIAAELRLAD